MIHILTIFTLIARRPDRLPNLPSLQCKSIIPFALLSVFKELSCIALHLKLLLVRTARLAVVKPVLIQLERRVSLLGTWYPLLIFWLLRLCCYLVCIELLRVLCQVLIGLYGHWKSGRFWEHRSCLLGTKESSSARNFSCCFKKFICVVF